MSTPARGGARFKRALPLLVLLAFFAPLLVSFLIYYGSDWRPAGRTNHGTLILPPRPLQPPSLVRIDADAPGGDGPAAADVLSGKWSLLYIGAGDCDADCRRTLYFMRQTHLGLGNLSPRLQRVFLVTERCCDRAFLAREHPGLITLDAQGAAGTQLLAQFPADRRATTIFIVDPRANLMMRYDADADPKGLRDDLKKLLSLSHIG